MPMNDPVVACKQSEEDEILADGVSDEALEVAASTGACNFTHIGCTSLPDCPGAPIR
jgi:hypothetical protein